MSSEAESVLSEMSLSLVSGGIDWLTLTSTNQKTMREMARCFRRVAVADYQLGYQTKPGGAWGFYGQRARHALIGQKEDRMMLVVSGKAARQCVVNAREGDNCTRLDIQLTLRVGEQNVSKWLEAQAELAEDPPKRRGKPRSVARVIRNKKIETVYIGDRSSDWFMRLYDKFTESKEEEYRGCVRMEVEVKGKASKALWAHMAQTGRGTMYLLSVLLWHAGRCGLYTGGMAELGKPKEAPRREKTKQQVTIGWWAAQVAPSVSRIVAERGWFEPFRVLFGKALTEEDEEGIIRALTLQWGS